MESLKLKLLKFLLGGKITIREANKYLDEVVEELKLKHEKVSHEDFDKDLEEITGIRWKQVKNYKNHPNPGQEIQDNSKVKTFILERRRHNNAHIFKRFGVLLLSLVISVLVLYRIFLPRETVKFVSIKEGTASIPKVTEAKIKLGIPGLADEIKLGTHKDKFSLGPCRTVQVSNTVCTHQMSGPQKFDATLFFTADYLTRVALMTQDKSLFEKFKSELSSFCKSAKKSDLFYAKELSTTLYELGQEKIVLSEPGPLMPKNASPLVYVLEIELISKNIQ